MKSFSTKENFSKTANYSIHLAVFYRKLYEKDLYLKGEFMTESSILYSAFLLINVLSFSLLSFDILWCRKGKRQLIPNAFLFVLFLLGGALGGCLAYLCWGRVQGDYAKTSRLRDSVLALRLPAAVLLVFQLILFLYFRTGLFEKIPAPSAAFLKGLGVWLIVLNLAAFGAFGLDKYKAIHKQYRIPIYLLFILAILGGSVGALAGMYLFRHKTTKLYFKLGIPLILALQLTLGAMLLI